MPGKPTLSRITIYPVKSLDGIDLERAMITEGGCLLHDREFAMFDENGNFINGKSNPLVHSLRSRYDLTDETISFRKNSEERWHQFHLSNDVLEIQSYLSEYFGMQVNFNQNKTGRFLDIPDIAGVTILSTSSLKTISGWYDNMNVDETRRRFRATLEIDGVEAFWEDHLFSTVGRGMEFTIGDATIFGMSPRARCVVPTRNTLSGEVTHAFPKIFSKHRSDTLPAWSSLNEYGHHYYLTVNCFIPATEAGKWVEVGDELKIIGEKIFY